MLMSLINENIKSHLHDLLISADNINIHEDFGCYINSTRIYKNLFRDPVQRIFFWHDDDYCGSIYVVYQYTYQDKKYYILTHGGFGSCSGCDYIMGTYSKQEFISKIENIFRQIDIYEDLNEITFSIYSHPDLKTSFNEFLKQQNK